METDKVRLRTYKQVWSQERVIYQIERVRLPFPISFRQAGVFAVTVLVVMLLSRFPGVAALSPVLRYVLIPGVTAWFMTRQRLDGKPPLRWALSMVRFLLSPKRLNRLRPISAQPGRIRMRSSIGYRVKG